MKLDNLIGLMLKEEFFTVIVQGKKMSVRMQQIYK
jgi:hypothetical protein